MIVACLPAEGAQCERESERDEGLGRASRSQSLRAAAARHGGRAPAVRSAAAARGPRGACGRGGPRLRRILRTPQPWPAARPLASSGAMRQGSRRAERPGRASRAPWLQPGRAPRLAARVPLARAPHTVSVSV